MISERELVIKPVPVQMFEEFTGFRAILIAEEPRGFLAITTKCQKKFRIRQVGPDLEVYRCY